MKTGLLTFRDIDFTFVLEDDSLHLIPPKDKHNIIHYEWFMRELGDGAYAPADPIPVDEPQLIGRCSETGQKIIFIPAQGSHLSFHNHKVIIDIAAYVEFRVGANVVDRAEFACPELNYIYRVNKGLTYTLGPEVDNNGVISVNTPDYEHTTSESQTFEAFGKQVAMSYGVTRTVKFGITQTPLKLSSSMVFDFEATDDFPFILNLYRVALNFIRFCCYRDNIYIPAVSLSSPYKGTTHLNVATLFVFNRSNAASEDELKKGRVIRQEYLSGKEGAILEDIANNLLYMRHWPDSYESGRTITEARFVMITAAFEWEFRRLYPDGVKHSKKTKDAEDRVIDRLTELKDQATSKERSIYKGLIGYVRNDSLQSEITQAGKDFADIITDFGDLLYHMNGEELNYNDMGLRLSMQRNDFAHGNLGKDFIGLAFLDLVFMERIIYAMQLKYYGVDDINIRKAINELFNCGLRIE